MDGPLTVVGTTNMAWYRVFVNSTGSHLWISDRNEFVTHINEQSDYVGEGVAAFAMPYLDDKGIFHDGVLGPAPVTNSIPFYRAAFLAKNLHFWTSDSDEFFGRNGKSLPSGYFGESIARYIFPTSGARLSSDPGVPVLSSAGHAEQEDDGSPFVIAALNSASYASAA